jgi:signal transduction histidine kinase/CheY-like chemotaxis protein
LDPVKKQNVTPSGWSVATSIIGSAALAGAGLFVVFLYLAREQAFTAAAIIILLGTAVITGLSIFAWSRESRRRIASLKRNVLAARQEKAAAEAETLQKSRMLATMSHEIRTPLNGVIGMLNLLLETDLSEEQKNYAKTASNAGRTLLSIVDEILDTAKGHSQRATSLKRADLRAVAESVTELLSARAHAKGIEISTYISPNLPRIAEMEDIHLRQILFNLAGNAIKFTDQGSVAIEFGCSAAWDLVISIADTGIGMNEAELSRIFGDFVQANDQTSTKFGGTGLGLGISKTIVESLGGRIDVSSIPKAGTTFVVRLPGVLTEQFEADALNELSGRRIILAMPEGATASHFTQLARDLGANISHVTTLERLRHHLQKIDLNDVLVADSNYADSLRDWAKAQGKSAKHSPQVWVMLKAEERTVLRDLIVKPFAGYLLKPLRRSSLVSRLQRNDSQVLLATAARLRAAKPDSKRTSRSLRILLADDNPINILLTRTILEKSGHLVTAVNSGESALESLATAKPFDIMLLDVEMPGLGGYETARIVRNREAAAGTQTRRLPILGLTAHNRREELELCIAAGMNDYLGKPFDQQDLAEAIAKLLQSRAAQAF